MSEKLKVLCVGAGHMGRSHALAYHRIEDYGIVGIVTRSPESRGALNEELGGGDSLCAVQACKQRWFRAGQSATTPHARSERAVMLPLLPCGQEFQKKYLLPEIVYKCLIRFFQSKVIQFSGVVFCFSGQLERAVYFLSSPCKAM